MKSWEKFVKSWEKAKDPYQYDTTFLCYVWGVIAIVAIAIAVIFR